MNKTRKMDLTRLLSPRSIAFVGGHIAEMAIRRCLEMGFEGEILPVNPKQETLAGFPCYPSVDALPKVPDAAHIAVRRDLAIDVVKRLSTQGAGGCVCYAAGFAEIGEEGQSFQDQLIDAAGSMPLAGPNCFGYLNYLDACALWPYVFGGESVETGAALISQSGNIAMNLSMNDRSLNISHIIATGNQAVLGPGDYMDALLDDDRVRAIGMYLEGLDDVDQFSRAASRALAKGVPIVVLKVGRTQAGAEQASSHTSALTGSDALCDALFERLGVIRVDSLNRLLETLKIFDLSGPLPGRNLLTMSCSGGEAAILADLTPDYGLKTPPFSEKQQQELDALFPYYVTVSNPFDYNVSVWGDRTMMERCFTTAMSGAHDAAILVYDHPTVASDDVDEWVIALDAFSAAHKATGMRAFVVCTITELLPRELRARLIAEGITPLQGMDDALFALSAAATYHEKQTRDNGSVTLPRLATQKPDGMGDSRLLDESESKSRLSDYGLSTPAGAVGGKSELSELASKIGYPVVVKAAGATFAHKSEMGAVVLDVQNSDELAAAAEQIIASAAGSDKAVESFLVEKMITGMVAELIVGVKRDAQFGPALVIGAGGVLVELVTDSTSLLLPTTEEAVIDALMSLKVAKLLKGFRGKPAGDQQAIVDAVLAVAAFAVDHWDTLEELDVNPLIVLPEGEGVIAADALIRMSV